MITYTVGYGPKYAGRGLIRMRATAEPAPRTKRVQPRERSDREFLAGALFLALQILILGLAIALPAGDSALRGPLG